MLTTHYDCWRGAATILAQVPLGGRTIPCQTRHAPGTAFVRLRGALRALARSHASSALLAETSMIPFFAG
jgi:hypothetical protein